MLGHVEDEIGGALEHLPTDGARVLLLVRLASWLRGLRHLRLHVLRHLCHRHPMRHVHDWLCLRDELRLWQRHQLTRGRRLRLRLRLRCCRLRRLGLRDRLRVGVRRLGRVRRMCCVCCVRLGLGLGLGLGLRRIVLL
jgi:hypothetical protein